MALLKRCALLLVLMVFLLIGSGALLTSVIRPLPGSPPETVMKVPVETVAHLRQIHEVLAGVVAVLALGLAIAASAGKDQPSVQSAAWLAAGLVLADAGLTGILHAVLAPFVFSSVVAVAVLTSKRSQEPPRQVPGLAVWVPMVLVLQIILGAGFRHDILGVIWHILNAMVVMVLILVLGVRVLRKYPGHPTLRPAALSLLIVTGVQVLLGFAVYVTLILVSENNLALTVTSAVHVLTGSLTLAASVVLTLQLRCL